MVQRVVTPGAVESWTVVDDEFRPVPPIEQYLAHLAAIERSPNTVRAYATSLKLWFEFLGSIGVDWREAEVETVSRFVARLRAPADNVIVLDASAARRSPATVNRHLAGLFGFYDHHARSGVELAASLVAWRRVGRGSYKPFLHHVTNGKPIPTRPVKMAVNKRLPRTLTFGQMVAIVDACDHLRDRFLFSLLAETGMRIGQALGIRHSDFVSRVREVHIVPRSDNANRARTKSRAVAVIPLSARLVRMYSDYMHTEYGDLDSDYVFVNLWAELLGHALTYQSVDGLVARLRARTGIWFTPHMFRHSVATGLLRHGVPVEVVARLLTHRSSATTSTIYNHLDVDDVRAELIKAGVWDAGEGNR